MDSVQTTYPAGGWLPPGAHFDWQRADQGRDFVTDWQGIIQAPGAGVCVGIGSDRPFPNGFGPRYPLVRIDEGAFKGHVFYIGHCTALVSPGQHFSFGHPLARADQGHNFAGTVGGWVELGNQQPDGSLGPNSPSGHWFDAALRAPLIRGGGSMKVGDHSNGGAIIGGSLKAAGFTGVVRYACSGRTDVNITPAEVHDLRANGLQVGVVCEHQADWLLRAGVLERVAASRNIARVCGLPDGTIYLAADFDSTLGGPTSPGSPGDQNMHGIAASLAVAAGVIGRGNVGFYGSYYAIDWLVSHGWADIKFWQTEAWSHGEQHPKACLFQRASSQSVHGVDVDIDDVWKPDWGQRFAAPPTPTPPEGTMSITAVVNENGHSEVYVHLQSGEVKNTYKVKDEKTGAVGWKRDAAGHNVWESLGTPGK